MSMLPLEFSERLKQAAAIQNERARRLEIDRITQEAAKARPDLYKVDCDDSAD